MLGISPMTTEMFIARGALFPRSIATSSHTHALGKYDVGARHMQATVRFLAFFRAAQARYPLAHRPRFTSPATLTCLGPRLERHERHPHALLPQVKTTVGHKIIVSAKGSQSTLASMIRKMGIQMMVKCVTMNEDIFCPSRSWQLLANSPWPVHHEGIGWTIWLQSRVPARTCLGSTIKKKRTSKRNEAHAEGKWQFQHSGKTTILSKTIHF